MTESFQVLTIGYQNGITKTTSDQAGYRSGNALHLYSVKFLVRILAETPAVLTQVFRWFLEDHARILPRTDHDYILPNPSQIIIQ
jgi:hypothetical protein